MPEPKLLLTASAANLKRLAMIRSCLIVGVLLGLAYLRQATDSDFFHPAYLAVLALFALANMLTYWRLQRAWPVTDAEYFAHLLLDIGGLTLLLYFAGGAANPFVSYYLVPITISAALLPWHYTWVVSAISLSAYTLMLFFYQPLAILQPNTGLHHHHDSGINLHILGMWLTFALSTLLITYFVVKMAHALRLQQQQQAANREDELRDEQIMAVATLAAGTAHELGTPLATITLLLEELQAAPSEGEALQQDLQLLQQQVNSCRRILSGLVSTAEIHHHQERRAENIRQYLEKVIERWQVLRPQAQIQTRLSDELAEHELPVDPTLEQAISNLLNNAADASPADKGLSLDAHYESGTLIIRVRDFGPGIPLDMAEQLGKPFVSTKGNGLGLGLFLSHATVNRYGGRITLYNHQQGGAIAELELPLATESEHHNSPINHPQSNEAQP